VRSSTTWLATLTLLGALVACTSSNDDTSGADDTSDSVVESGDTRVIVIGWGSQDWTAAFDGHHYLYAYDRTNDFHTCRFQWTTSPVEQVTDCDACDFAYEVRYSLGEVLEDPITGDLTEDCSNFGLADGHSFAANRMLGFASSWSPDGGATNFEDVLMQYFEFDPDEDGQEPGWYGVATVQDYQPASDASAGSLTYSAAYAYYEYQ
jgi:hypothetical protein